MERLRTQEMAEMLAFNLLQHLDFAPALAYKWIASDSDMYQLCGYQLLARLFARGMDLTSVVLMSSLIRLIRRWKGNNLPLKHAAYNCVLSFCELGDEFRCYCSEGTCRP